VAVGVGEQLDSRVELLTGLAVRDPQGAHLVRGLGIKEAGDVQR
jgi:hypothetical protein